MTETMEENSIPEVEEAATTAPDDAEEAENDKLLLSERYDKEFVGGFDDGGPPPADNEEEEGAEEGEAAKEKTPPEAEGEEKTPQKENREEPAKEEEQEKPPQPLKVFFLGKEIEVKPEEIPDLVQRGLNEERMKRKLQQLEAESEPFDAFMDMAAYYNSDIKDMVKNIVERLKSGEVAALAEDGTTEEKAAELFNQRLSNAKSARANQPKPKGKERDMTAEIDELMSLRPDLRGIKEFPQEVAERIRQGVDVKTAYLTHENQALRDAEQTLKSQTKALEIKLQALEQEKKNLKAPGSVKGAGASVKTDAFLVGFNEN